MEYPGAMMPYPPQGGGDMKPPQMHHSRGFKSRGQKNNAYRGKKHPRVASHGDTSGACFKCGSPDHWAPQCPENPREYHAGGHMHPNPPKRQKTHRFGSGQPYGGPDFRSQPPYDYANAPPMRPDYDYMPMDRGYDYPMPNAPPQPSFSRWQQGPPPEGYPYPGYAPRDVPPPMPGHGQPYPGPPTSPGHGYFPREYGTYPEEADYHQYSPGTRQPPAQERRHRQPSRTWKRTDKAQNSFTRPEPWANEPGRPESDERSSGNSHIVWKPPLQVARPLPSIFDDRDEMGSLPPVSSLPPGMSVSKYILDRSSDEFRCNIRETEDWPFMMSDPIFLEISSESEMISMEELISRRNKIFETHKVQVKSHSPREDISEEEGEEGEEERTEDNYQEEQRSRGSSALSPGGKHGTHSPPSPDRDSRASPLTPSNEPEQSETVQRSPKRHSESPKYHTEAPKYRAESPSDELDGPPSGPKLKQLGEEKHDSEQPEDDWEQRRLPPHHRNGEQGSHSDKQNRQRPTANQLPKKQQQRPFDRRSNQANKPGKRTRGDASGQQFNHQISRSNPDNNSDAVTNPHSYLRSGNHNSANVAEPTTPLETANEPSNRASADVEQSHGQLDHGNRSHQKKDERATKKEPRRQEDDTTPNLKRRQPRVAEAYSRRW